MYLIIGACHLEHCQIANVYNYAGCDRTPTNVSSQRGVASSDGSGKRRPPLSLSSK